jgi:hypothetical protein
MKERIDEIFVQIAMEKKIERKEKQYNMKDERERERERERTDCGVGRWRAVVIGFRPEMVAAVATVVVRYDSCVVAICSFTLLSSSFFSLYFGFCVLVQPLPKNH